ncbi:GGDEF domain-containing protein [Kineococcus glutinatus]|uniref:GGDEF domain-containing protein n=1 Tax=Kineococcus glutinatus TaxID=1070872 RepID=UPI0031ECEA2E
MDRGAQRQDSVGRTRSLFLVCVLASLLVVTTPVAVLASVAHTALALGVGAVLAGSWWRTQAGRATPWPVDVLEGALLVVLVSLCPVPTSVLSVAFSSLWFRSMYGSTVRAFVRVGLVMVALSTGLLLWERLHPAGTSYDPAALFSGFPMLVLNVCVIRALLSGLRGRDEAARREAVVAVLGADLLSAADTARIHALAWSALEDLCATTPGLSLVVVASEGDALRPVRSCGPAVDVGSGAGPVGGVPAEGAVLVDGGGGWGCLRLPGFAGDAWLVVAGPRRAVEAGVDGARAVVHQVVLALRNAEARDALRAQARTDALTGLPNRAAFGEAVAAELADPHSVGCALLFVDLDGFKAVNDGMGHAAGDALLRTVAARLRHVLRDADVCARLGGDEFAVLLPATDAASAAAAGRRVVEALGAPVRIGGERARIGASVGVAHSSDGAGGTADALLRRADAAMYAAKAAGKGCVRTQPGGRPVVATA